MNLWEFIVKSHTFWIKNKNGYTVINQAELAIESIKYEKM
jgi:hypothetical protein